MTSTRRRSPGFKLALAVLIAGVLIVPLLMVYALVWDRQQQSDTARAAITQGWGGQQIVAGPVLVVPYIAESVETVTENGQERSRTVRTQQELFVSPIENRVSTSIDPQQRRKSIYVSVLYDSTFSGQARFALPADLERFGVPRESLLLDRAEVRVGVSDARGLRTDTRLSANGQPLEPQPGKGVAATNGSGFFAFVDWDGGPITIDYRFGLRGSGAVSLVPRGGNTDWTVQSTWPHPSFGGNFLPEKPSVGSEGFKARYGVANLALGQAMVMTTDPAAPPVAYDQRAISAPVEVAPGSGQSQAATVGLIEPVDLYSQVERSVKYGFLFIGFTFLAFLMFDIIGGARVAAAEYLLTGAALVLFFVLLLAFAEVIGFTLAYLLASAAIVGLLASYSAAILHSRRRAGFIGALLVGLYGLLYVLLNLEAYSLLIGSVLLFVALAAVMWATRRLDWSGLTDQSAAEVAEPDVSPSRA